MVTAPGKPCAACGVRVEYGQRYCEKHKGLDQRPSLLETKRIPEIERRSDRKIVIVCGPPGSGKSGYVQERVGKKDEVIDLDVIKAELTGIRLYQAGSGILDVALAERNKRLIEAARRTGGVLWFIVCAPTRIERRTWKERLQADEVVLLDVPAVECKRRIMDDLRRGDKRMEHCKAVDRWWREYEPD